MNKRTIWVLVVLPAIFGIALAVFTQSCSRDTQDYRGDQANQA
jgi:hypothetical protein